VCRLPDGVGTKADVIELLKDSQWFQTEGIPYAEVNATIGGTLDRLQSEPDPCVRYDVEKKLWVYLHMNRKVSENKDWQQEREGDSWTHD